MDKKIAFIIPIINFITIYFLIGKIVDISMADAVGYAITATLVEILLFKKYIWKWKFVSNITGICNIQGEWQGKIHSNYDDSDHIIKKVVIKQSFNKYKVVLETDESTSFSDVNYLQNDEFGRLKLEYIYKNESSAINRKDNPMHFGVAKLLLKDDRLEGTYWTDREIDDGKNTRGTIVFEKQNKKGNYDLISLLDIFDLF